MSNDALFDIPSKDKVEMNEREMKYLKNLSKHFTWGFEVEEKRRRGEKTSWRRSSARIRVGEGRVVLAKSSLFVYTLGVEL